MNYIDFNNDIISINKTFSTGEKYKVYVSTPKTDKSIIKIKLDSETLKKLEELYIKSSRYLVFPSQSGKHMQLSNIKDRLNTIIKQTGIKMVRENNLNHT